MGGLYGLPFFRRLNFLMLCCTVTRPEVLEFRDPLVARRFHEDEQAYYITHFVTRQKSVEALAADLNISVSTMRRWVKRFLDLRLVKIVGVDGKGSYLYRLSAPKLINHDEAALLDTHEDFVRTLGPLWERFMNAAVNR